MKSNSTFKTNVLRFFRITYCKSGIFITTFLAFMPLLWYIISELLGRWPDKCVLIFFLSVLLILLQLLLSLFISYLVGFKNLSPKKFAKAAISGRFAGESLIYLAKRIKKICEGNVKVNEPTLALLTDLNECLSSNDKAKPVKKINAIIAIWKSYHGDKLSVKTIKRLNKLFTRQSKWIKRVEAMKLVFAKEHKISIRKLSNHILNYSTSIYLDRSLKQKRDWEELQDTFANSRIKDLKGVNSKDLLKRINGLVFQLISTNRVMDSRARRQGQLMRLEFLSAFCIEIAKERSSSGGLFLYAQTISLIAKNALVKMQKGWRRESIDELIKETEELLNFVYRKQQAYSGYDLHELLLGLVRHIRLDAKGDNKDKLNNIEKLLSGVNAKNKDKSKLGHLFYHPETEIKRPMDLRTSKEMFLERLACLSDLRLLTAYHLCHDQENVMSIYRDLIFPEFFKGKTGNRYIVTHGYSKIVRQILKHALPKDNKNKNLIYILSENTYDEDARLLKYELKSETRKEVKKYGSIAIGGFDNLSAQYNPEKDSMILVLGADCYDEHGHILFHRSLKEQLKSNLFCAKKYRKQHKILVTIAVEQYKKLDTPLTESVAYDDHLDQIQFFNKEMSDLIINESALEDKAAQALIIETIEAIKK